LEEKMVTFEQLNELSRKHQRDGEGASAARMAAFIGALRERSPEQVGRFERLLESPFCEEIDERGTQTALMERECRHLLSDGRVAGSSYVNPVERAHFAERMREIFPTDPPPE
jgi:hypothetical protein